jgi:ribonuclease P protein component
MARFPRRARLLKPDEFKNVFGKGFRTSERWLSAIATPNAIGEARLGLAVAKKTVPDAVDRNRIKRQIRESFRQHRQQLPPVDIVLLTRAGCHQATVLQRRQILERLWTRIAASCNASASS